MRTISKERLLIFFLLLSFFLYHLSIIDYGLPFFFNADETAFVTSTIGYVSFITGINLTFLDPIYAPLINLILTFYSVFINEFLINSLSISQIKSKIYLNPELFIFYGRVASLIVSTCSIYLLYLIFKKLKINIIIYGILLVTFATSLVSLSISSVDGKNSYYLLFFLIQIYFFIKYLIKIEKFKFKSYIIFAILASIAWGINYWPAFVSIYAIMILHLRKFNFSKIYYPITFFIIFIIFGPIINMIYSNEMIIGHIININQINNFDLSLFFIRFIDDFIICLKILFFSEKNFLILLIFTPIFLINKHFVFKKNFLIILLLLLEPIILFSISEKVYPELRYFAGNICIILILVSIIFNEFYKQKTKYITIFLLISNFIFIINNIKIHHEISNIISEKYSFYNFNEDIKKYKPKVLYLVDLKFRKNITNNMLYYNLHQNNLIKNSDFQKDSLNEIIKKISYLETKSNDLIDDRTLKESIRYFNYNFFEIIDNKLFFDFLKKDFDYVVINKNVNNNINNYVKNNFVFERDYINNKNKIFFKKHREILRFYSLGENYKNSNLDKIYGENYSLYKLDL